MTIAPGISLDIDAIYNMDCFELMRHLPDICVDLVLTDPPYGIRHHNGYTLSPYRPLTGDDDFDYPLFAKECYRVLADNTHAYFFTRFDQYPYHYACLSDAGFTIKNCLVIEKGHVGGIGDLYGSYANNCEWVIFCQKGRRVFNQTKLMKNIGPVGQIASRHGNPLKEYKTRFNSCWFGEQYPKSTLNSNTKARLGLTHPTVKNVLCFEWIIRISSDEGQIIFDPCMGSGTTAVAAKNTHRHFLGSEIDTGYWRLSQSICRKEGCYWASANEGK